MEKHEHQKQGAGVAEERVERADQAAGANGSITPGGNVSVRTGSDQTFLITPDEGYAISDVRIDGRSIGEVMR